MSRKIKPDHIAQQDWDSVASPGIPEERIDKLRPVLEAHPDLLKAYHEGTMRRRGPQKAPTKTLVSMRYSQEVLDFFRATGPRWQTKMDEALKQWIQEHPGPASTSGR